MSIGWAEGDDNFMSVDEIRRGMKGKGKTVFQGTKIEEFDVEILGVMKNWRAKGDLILARLSGGPLPLEKTGLIAGMSGSPIYIDGKLIGAVAYGWSFAKEPIAGITPITEMIDVLERGLDGGYEASGIGLMGKPGEGDSQLSISEDMVWRHTGLRGIRLEPVGTPLVLSGFDVRAIDAMEDELSTFGFVTLQGGGGSAEEYGDIVFEPGAALGIQFVRGDLSATGIGTLTYRDGDKVLGFGHPAFLTGITDIPMTGAYIHDVISSQSHSFKIGGAAGLLGSVRQDRSPGIGGIIGEIPDMVPVTVVIGSDEYSFEVIRRRDFGPFFVRYSLFSSVMSAEKLFGDATVKVKSKVQLEGHPDLELENVYSGSGSLFRYSRSGSLLGTIYEISQPLFLLAKNDFERVNLKGVEFEIDVEEKIQSAKIEKISADKEIFKPGDEVDVSVILKPNLDKRFEVKGSLKIPEWVLDGRLTLLAGDAGSSQSAEIKRAPDRYVPRDLDDLLRLISEKGRNDEIVLVLLSQDRGVTIDGRELPDLPGSFLSLFESRKESGETKAVGGAILDKQKVKTDFVVVGSRSLSLTVDRNVR